MTRSKIKLFTLVHATWIVLIALATHNKAIAQPLPYGCHYFRNLGNKHAALTTRDMELINESIARSDTFDILHYNIHLDVTDYTGGTIDGATSITFRPKMEDQEHIRFDLFQLQVDSVKDVSGSLVFNHDGSILDVQLSSIPALTDTLELTVWYHGEPYQDPVWGGFYFEANYIYNLGIGLTTIPPNFGKVWYPCFDSFVERATYEYHIKSAGTYRAFCQGDFLGEEVLEGDTVIRSFEMNVAIPTHISAIAVADYTSYEYVHSGLYGDVPVTLTSKPAQQAGMQNVFQDLGYAIDACEFWYGPHAFSRVGYVLTTDGALEIPTNIAYPQFMTGESLASNGGLFSHELGHHWWGDMVTPHNHNDMWMKEGPAEYTSHLFVEQKDGWDAFIETVKDNQLFVLENAHIDDGGFQALSPMPDEYIYGTHTYYKGAAVLHNLRGYLGDELFRQGMSGVQANYAGTDMTPEQLRDALEEETGFDLHPFFDDQIFSPGFATFVVDSFAAEPNGDQWNVVVNIQQKLRACPHFHQDVPLDLTVVGADWQRQDFRVTADDEFSEVTVTADFEPVLVILNGYNRLNQNRMDLELVLTPETSLGPILPWVDFKLYDDAVVDSTFVRIEHVWSAPDDEDLGPGVYSISSTHYWNISGLWPEGTQFSGRVQYRGAESTDLDFDLFNGDESDAILLYRATPAEPFHVYPNFTLNAGNLFNGSGNIDIDILLPGEYAFGTGDASVNTEELSETRNGLELFPVPADSKLTIRGHYDGQAIGLFEILDSQGKIMIRSTSPVNGSYEKTIDTDWLPDGYYLVRVRTETGELLGISGFTRMR